jgi:CO dehydrogenase maturation factor
MSPMKIAVAGKGGSGKTTIAGALARELAGRGVPVVALDDDSNPNLAVSLGLGREAALPTLPRDLLAERVDESGTRWLDLTVPADEIIERFGIKVGPHLTLLVMGQPAHGGSG